MQSTTELSHGVSARDLCIIAAVYVSCFLFLLGFPHMQAGFPLDDSWIHQVVARNLASDGTLGFIPGVRSSGSSSLLWSFLLAAKWKFMPGVEPVAYSGVLSGLLLAATGWGLLAMARRDGAAESSCWIWALTPALDGNFMWLGALGMEHVLFVALSVLGIYFWFDRGGRSAIACAACLGALSLTRPEGLVLGMLAVLASRWARRGRRDAGLVIGTVLFCFGLFLTANFITSHSWLPTTYAGRKWLYFGTEHLTVFQRVVFPVGVAQNVLHTWFLVQTHMLYWLTAFVLLLTAMGFWVLLKERRLRMLFVCLWSFVHIEIYAVMLPSRSHGGRYQPLFLALAFPLMFLGIERIVRWMGRRFRAARARVAFQTAVGVVSFLCALYSLRIWRHVTRDGITVIESCHAEMGRLLKTLPPQSKVAAFDIGRMGFLYGGRLVDLGGLTDSSFLPYMREQRLMAYLSERGIDYFVWPSSLDGSSGVPQVFTITAEEQRGLTKVASFCAPENAWRISYAATVLASPCQTLYRRNRP